MKEIEKSRAEQVKFLKLSYGELQGQITKDRPYRIPKGYTSWDTIATCLAAGINAFEGKRGEDWALRIHGHRCGVWLTQNAPVYLVERDLLRQFQESDLDFSPDNRLLENLEFPLTTVLLLFPQNAILATSEGTGCVDWAIIHLSDTSLPENSRVSYQNFEYPALPHEENYRRNFQWSSIDSAACAWFSGCNITDEGSLLQSGKSCGLSPIFSGDKEFIHSMKSLCFQCLLALNFQTRLIYLPLGRQGTGKAREKRSQSWAPRRLIAPKVGEKEPRIQSHQTTRTSPHPHWRRGHWRNQSVGTGRLQKKLVWIPPIYIG
jgi:hypothetical protein